MEGGGRQWQSGRPRERQDRRLSRGLRPPGRGLLALYQAPFDPRWYQAAHRLLGAATSGFRPHQVVAYGPPGETAPAVPLLEDRGLVDSQAAAYACRDFACQAPVTEPDELLVQLTPAT